MPSLEKLCDNVGQSQQVARPRLSVEGSCYQPFKDTVCQDLALELLNHQTLPISAVAEQAGFSAPAAFSRAFKKWQQRSPADYRQSLAANGYTKNYPISQFYLDARVQRIYGGSNEIVKEVISRSL